MLRSRPLERHAAVALVACLAFSLALTEANAEFVSYVANITTSTGNPVTDLLILEEDLGGLVHASVFGSDLPGFGTSVVGHDPGFDPVRSLILGLTVGADDTGAPKKQIMAFLDDDFAAANVARKWSEVFLGSRHSLTINSLTAAVAGDTGEQAWFTETFYPGPAAGAAFVSGGSFTIAEFSALSIIGASVTDGNWIVTSKTDVSGGSPDSQSSQPTVTINETATDLGPFDISSEIILGSGVFAVEKNVTNDSDVDWIGFEQILGTGLGDQFTPRTDFTDLRFIDSFTNEDQSGTFPDVTFEQGRLVFSGGTLAPGETATFVAFLETPFVNQEFTFRQTAFIPEPATGALALLGMSGVLVLFRRRG